MAFNLMVPTQLIVAGINKQVGIIIIKRPVQPGLDLYIEFFADLRGLALGKIQTT